jgi:hypothetical protein
MNIFWPNEEISLLIKLFLLSSELLLEETLARGERKAS